MDLFSLRSGSHAEAVTWRHRPLERPEGIPTLERL
jgi:hypothetical protein